MFLYPSVYRSGDFSTPISSKNRLIFKSSSMKLTAVDWLINYMKSHFSLTEQEVELILSKAKEQEDSDLRDEFLSGYKKGWREANEEVQKYVDSLNKYSFLK